MPHLSFEPTPVFRASSSGDNTIGLRGQGGGTSQMTHLRKQVQNSAFTRLGGDFLMPANPCSAGNIPVWVFLFWLESLTRLFAKFILAPSVAPIYMWTQPSYAA